MFTRSIAFLNNRIKPPLLKHEYSVHVEQYRGLCALLVLMAHGFGDEKMITDNFKWPEFMHYISAGYLSVLVFFCVSGYVIGLTNDHEKLDVKKYLQKRMLRLYPIYLFAIVICIIIAGGVSLFVLSGNLLFLENDLPYFNFRAPIFINYPTWSLNYEALYYLLFIGVFFLRPKVWHMLVCMAIISLSTIHCSDSFLIFVCYNNGFYFWMLGLLITWGIFKTETPKDQSIPLLSIMFLHLCTHHLGIGEIILHVMGVYSKTNFNCLFFLPFCLMVMCILTGKDNAFLRFNKKLSYILPGCVFLYLILHHRIFEDIRWEMCLLFWILSLAFYYEKRVSGFFMDKLTSIGKISYALYLLHVPVAKLIKKTIFISDHHIEGVVKYSLWIFVTFTLAFVLERVLQPAVKKYFSSRHP